MQSSEHFIRMFNELKERIYYLSENSNKDIGNVKKKRENIMRTVRNKGHND